MQSNITIIIPTFNRKEYLRNILAQLLSQQLLESISLNIIVVVDGSTDGTLEMLQSEFKKVHFVIGDGNWWFTKCINEGFNLGKKLNTNYYLLLNDDVEVDDDYIAKLFKAYNSIDNPNSILGSISYSISSRSKIIEAGIIDYNSFLGKYNYYYRYGSEVDPSKLKGLYPSKELSARGTLMPSAIVEDLGGYDSRFIQYGSDTDFCYTAKKKGYKVYISWDSPIFCYDEMTSVESTKFRNPTFSTYLKSLTSEYSSNSLKLRLLFVRKHYGILKQLIIIPKLFIDPFIIYFYRKLVKN